MVIRAGENGYLVRHVREHQDQLDLWTDVSISTALYRAAVPYWVAWNGDPTSPGVLQPLPPELLRALAEALEHYRAAHPGHRGRPQAFSLALYGLRVQSDSPECRQLLRGLAELAGACRRGISAQELGCALYGLHRLGNSPEVEQVLSAVAAHVPHCGDPLGLPAAGMALYGLRLQLNSKASEELLAALAAALRAPRACCAADVGRGLFGLRRHNDCPAVRALLGALSGHVARCAAAPGTVPTLTVANALCGLRWVAWSPALDCLLRALAPVVRCCSAAPKPGHVAMALFGLASQDYVSTAIEELLLLLVPFAGRCRGPLSPLEGAIALYGLNGLGHSPAAEGVVAALAPFLSSRGEPGQERANAKQLHMAVYGLRLQRSSPAVRAALSALKGLAADCGNAVPQSVSEAMRRLEADEGPSAGALAALPPYGTAGGAEAATPKAAFAVYGAT